MRELVRLGPLDPARPLELELGAQAIQVRTPEAAVTVTPALLARQLEVALASSAAQEVTVHFNNNDHEAPALRFPVPPGITLWRSPALEPATLGAEPVVRLEPAAAVSLVALRVTNTYRGAGHEALGDRVLLLSGRCQAAEDVVQVQAEYFNRIDVEAAWGLTLEVLPAGTTKKVGWWNVPVVVKEGQQSMTLTLRPQEGSGELVINDTPFEAQHFWHEPLDGDYQITLALWKNGQPQRSLPLCGYRLADGRLTVEPEPGALLALRAG